MSELTFSKKISEHIDGFTASWSIRRTRSGFTTVVDYEMKVFESEKKAEQWLKKAEEKFDAKD